MRTRMRLILLGVILALALAGCAPAAPASAPTAAEAEPPATQPAAEATPEPAGGATVEVTIKGFAFSPGTVKIKVGDTVKWTNQDGAGHDIVSNDGVWASPILAKGESYSFTFDRAGTYPYICGVHPSMKATIEVTP